MTDQTAYRTAWAKLIKAKRTALGLNQVQLGELVGVTKVSVCQWEHGDHAPGPQSIRKLCQVLGIADNELARIYRDAA